MPRAKGGVTPQSGALATFSPALCYCNEVIASSPCSFTPLPHLHPSHPLPWSYPLCSDGDKEWRHPGPTGKGNFRFVLMFLKRGSQKNKRSREVLALTTSALLLAVMVLCTQRDSLGKSVESSLPLTFWSFFLALPYQEPFPRPRWQVLSSTSVYTLHATYLCHRADAVSPFCVFPVS